MSRYLLVSTCPPSSTQAEGPVLFPMFVQHAMILCWPFAVVCFPLTTRSPCDNRWGDIGIMDCTWTITQTCLLDAAETLIIVRPKPERALCQMPDNTARKPL